MSATRRPGINEAEAKHGATLPTAVYPLFENALRAHYGRSLDAHQAALGELFAPFTEVAATNPYAWFREAKSAHEIATATPSNRYIGFPYTKYMNSIIDVDQGAALLMTSVGEARRLGIPEERWVYVWGCGDATDHWFFTERENYLLVARDPRRRDSERSAWPASASATSRTSICIAASRRRCRSRATCSASRPATRGR